MDEFMDELLNKDDDLPEESETPASQAAKEDADDADAPAEMSLEGRKSQLEEKVTAELDKSPAPQAGEGQPYKAPAQFAPKGNYPQYPQGSYSYGASQAAVQKEKLPQGAKAYIILIAGLIVVFIFAFVFESARTYKQNGMFGGSLERFLDSDFVYDPFGTLEGDDEDEDTDSEKRGFGGLFPFGFDDSDTPSGGDLDSDYDFKYSGELQDAEEPIEVKPAPDKNNVTNSAAAVLSANDQPEDIDSPEYTTRKAYKKVENSVVGIVVYPDEEDIGIELYKTGTGSGIIVSEDGYVITNSHVISDSSECGVEVITANGDRYAAAIVGFDSRTDLAVLKIDGADLVPVEFMNSDQVEVGQDALAIGYPGGLSYSNSLTRGCVSALNRTVQSRRLGSYIQTDAAINPGNSGGPLLNSAGQVMGITTIKIASTDYEGMGFAIPSNTVIQICNDLIAQGFVAGRVKLGVKIYSEEYTGSVNGLLIAEIMEDSPLMKTDVEPGDVITKVDGKAVPDINTLYSILGEHNPGDEVTLTVYRPPTTGNAEKTFEAKVTLVSDEGEK